MREPEKTVKRLINQKPLNLKGYYIDITNNTQETSFLHYPETLKRAVNLKAMYSCEL